MFDALPSWARAAFALGVPSVIAMGLAYWLTSSLDGRLIVLTAKVDTHESARSRDTQAMNAFLYAICLNTANDPTARARCAVAAVTGK